MVCIHDGNTFTSRLWCRLHLHELRTCRQTPFVFTLSHRVAWLSIWAARDANFLPLHDNNASPSGRLKMEKLRKKGETTNLLLPFSPLHTNHVHLFYLLRLISCYWVRLGEINGK